MAQFTNLPLNYNTEEDAYKAKLQKINIIDVSEKENKRKTEKKKRNEKGLPIKSAFFDVSRFCTAKYYPKGGDFVVANGEAAGP